MKPGPVPVDPVLRFWPKVTKTETCWLWNAGCFNNGYSSMNVDGKRIGAHRFAYEILVGPIPPGLTVDHLCHNEAAARGECAGGVTCRHRRCVNPAHLEAVTSRVNLLRATGAIAVINLAKTECPRGHPYSDTNTYEWRGHRGCRICKYNRNVEWKARVRAAASNGSTQS